ncbi:MAG: hypothetical protein ACT4OJ_06400 [Bacteroidota bacterium]
MKQTNSSTELTEAVVAAFFDLKSGFALVAENDIEWLSKCRDIVVNKDNSWEVRFAGEPRIFDVIPVSASVVTNARPKTGDRRRWRRATCGGGEAAKIIPCFPLSSGRFAKVELAGYSTCIRSDKDEFCDEEYVEIGKITIARDANCRIVAQSHTQYRWVCLPTA